MVQTNRFIALSCALVSVFATSCENEIQQEPTTVTGDGYYISMTGELNDETAAIEGADRFDFAWYASDTDMKSFVLRDNDFVDFKENKKYSDTKVTPLEGDNNKAQLQMATSLSEEYAKGDLIWSVFPLSDTDITADNNVTFTLPDVFTQTESNSGKHLIPYILISGTGSVEADSTANIKFDILPAICRFKVTNDDADEVLTIKEVSLSGPFSNKAELSISNGTVSEEYSTTDGTYTIKVATPEEGLNIAAGETAYLYALVFPTKTSTITDKITVSCKGVYGETSADYTEEPVCNEKFTSDIISNNCYDIEISLENENEEENEEEVDPAKSVVTLFEGEKVLNSEWSDSQQISSFYLKYLSEGDVLTVYFKGYQEGAQKSLSDNHNWSNYIGDPVITENEINQGYYTYTVTSDAAAKLKLGDLIVGGLNYTITRVTLETTVKDSYCEPVADNAIMLSDFEGHTAEKDPSWSSSAGVTLEYPQENENTYLRLASSPSTVPDGGFWLFNCTGHSNANVTNIENYVIKFDLKIEAGVIGASEAQMQYVLCHDGTSAQWLYVGAGFFPETTDGKWITVSRNISDINNQLTGPLSFSGTTNGMYFNSAIPAGICIDNFRLEPKK